MRGVRYTISRGATHARQAVMTLDQARQADVSEES
jgi:hypothetical protein